ncbi:hypothetical protein ACHQM5_029074 [Ranunculus cassubicifolius]
MASSKRPSVVVAVVIFMFALILLPSTPVGLGIARNEEPLKQKKMVIGSRPPLCINRCYRCRPCKATLVIPPHKREFIHKEDDTYYLLTWKCRCGNRVYQP